VAAFRHHYPATTVARRRPPYASFLFPFAHGEDVAARYGSELEAHFTTFEPFDAKLTGVGDFADFSGSRRSPETAFSTW
jgi:hypothetical protein